MMDQRLFCPHCGGAYEKEEPASLCGTCGGAVPDARWPTREELPPRLEGVVDEDMDRAAGAPDEIGDEAEPPKSPMR